MRVLLLNPPFHPRFSRSQRSPARTKSGNLYYPIWLGYATGVLEQAGHEVRLVDAPARGLSRYQTVRLAVDFRPQLLVLDTSTPSILNDLDVAQSLRTALPRPHTFLTAVGTHASALPTETLVQAPWLDGLARREYDYTLRDLAATLATGDDLRSVLGLSYWSSEEIVHNPPRPELTAAELDAIPFVSRIWQRHVHIPDYFYSITPHPQITIVTGRGCPYKCDFCVWPQVLTGHGYRRRSVENVIEEFLWIGHHLPGVHVFLEDDTLTVNKKRCHELAEGLLRAGSRVRFTANARADVDYETLLALKRAGLRMVCTGFESADNGILQTIEKRLRVEQARQFVEDAKRAGVLVHGCFMVGNPGETRQTLQQTLDFARQISPDSAQFFPLMVYPGTKAYDRAVAEGALVSRDWGRWLTTDGLHNTVIDRPELPAAELVAWCNYARRRFYLRPQYLGRKLWQGLRDRHEMRRNLMAARTLAGHLLRPRS
jgi:anaerobic magnesium-protoporphyrin IX monomethyl ester cyclase